MTSKPLASGSSVPVWPARLAPRRRFDLCSTAFELGPTGFLTSRTPLIASCSASPRDIGLFDLLAGDRSADQLRQLHAALDRSVVPEAYLRGDAKSQALSELGSQESARAIETRLDRRQGFRIGQSREENFGVGKVGGDLYPGEGDHADERVLELGAQQFRQLALDLIGDAAPALLVGHQSSRSARIRSEDPSLRRALLGTTRASKCPRHFLDFVDFELVADLEVVEVFHGHAALETSFHFAHVVLEALERINLARMDDHVVAQHAHQRVATHQALEHHASSHGPDLGDLEYLAHVDEAEYGFFFLRREHARERRLHFV